MIPSARIDGLLDPAVAVIEGIRTITHNRRPGRLLNGRAFLNRQRCAQIDPDEIDVATRPPAT
jgi:hypothetical protein